MITLCQPFVRTICLCRRPRKWFVCTKKVLQASQTGRMALSESLRRNPGPITENKTKIKKLKFPPKCVCCFLPFFCRFLLFSAAENGRKRQTNFGQKSRKRQKTAKKRQAIGARRNKLLGINFQNYGGVKIARNLLFSGPFFLFSLIHLIPLDTYPGVCFW